MIERDRRRSRKGRPATPCGKAPNRWHDRAYTARHHRPPQFQIKPPGMPGGLFYLYHSKPRAASTRLSLPCHHAIEMQLHLAVDHAAHSLDQAMRFIILLPTTDN